MLSRSSSSHVQERGLSSSELYRAAIAVLRDVGRLGEALDVYGDLRRAGYAPDNRDFGALLALCAERAMESRMSQRSGSPVDPSLIARPGSPVDPAVLVARPGSPVGGGESDRPGSEGVGRRRKAEGRGVDEAEASERARGAHGPEQGRRGSGSRTEERWSREEVEGIDSGQPGGGILGCGLDLSLETIDLHGLSAPEARAAVLLVLRSLLDRHRGGLAVEGDLLIVTGSGQHSGVSGPKLMGIVGDMLCGLGLRVVRDEGRRGEEEGGRAMAARSRAIWH